MPLVLLRVITFQDAAAQRRKQLYQNIFTIIIAEVLTREDLTAHLGFVILLAIVNMNRFSGLLVVETLNIRLIVSKVLILGEHDVCYSNESERLTCDVRYNNAYALRRPVLMLNLHILYHAGHQVARVVSGLQRTILEVRIIFFFIAVSYCSVRLVIDIDEQVHEGNVRVPLL